MVLHGAIDMTTKTEKIRYSKVKQVFIRTFNKHQHEGLVNIDVLKKELWENLFKKFNIQPQDVNPKLMQQLNKHLLRTFSYLRSRSRYGYFNYLKTELPDRRFTNKLLAKEE